MVWPTSYPKLWAHYNSYENLYTGCYKLLSSADISSKRFRIILLDISEFFKTHSQALLAEKTMS